MLRAAGSPLQRALLCAARKMQQRASTSGKVVRIKVHAGKESDTQLEAPTELLALSSPLLREWCAAA